MTEFSRMVAGIDVGDRLCEICVLDDQGEVVERTRAGNTYLRRLLVNAAHYVLGPFGPDSKLRRVGLAIAARGGKRARKMAVVAVARRLAVLLIAMWKSGESYEPFPGLAPETASVSENSPMPVALLAANGRM